MQIQEYISKASIHTVWLWFVTMRAKITRDCWIKKNIIGKTKLNIFLLKMQQLCKWEIIITTPKECG